MSRYRQVDNLPIIYIMSSNGYPNVPPSACPLALPTWIPLHSSSVHHVAVASVRTSVTHAAPAHAHPVDTGPQSPEHALQVLGAVDIRAIGEMPELEILHCLAYAVDCARYWEPPDEEDLIFVRPEVIAALRPIAQTLLDSSHTAWWTEPADLLNQHLVEKRNPHLRLVGLTRADLPYERRPRTVAR